jgi:hypothetical protein
MGKWVVFYGLALMAVGAAMAAWNIVNRQGSLDRLSAAASDAKAFNSTLKADLVALSRGTVRGLALVVIGAAVQIVGTFMPS